MLYLADKITDAPQRGFDKQRQLGSHPHSRRVRRHGGAMAKSENYATEGLEMLDVGVAIFDPDSRLVFANQAFRAMRRYPEDVCCTGATLASLLHFNAARGDFGPGDVDAQTAERLAETGEHAAGESGRCGFSRQPGQQPIQLSIRWAAPHADSPLQ